MEIIKEIAIRLKDRVIVLDKDLLERKLDVRSHTDLYKYFHNKLKGRHYKNLKQGSGWSFATCHFDHVSFDSIAKPPVQQVSEKLQQERRYDVDIPLEIRDYFSSYRDLIFPTKN